MLGAGNGKGVALAERLDGRTKPRFHRLNKAICELIDEWSMVQFLPLDPTDSDTVDLVLAQLDTMLQYHDDVEPKEMMEGDDEDDADHDGFFGLGSCDNDGGGGSG